MKKAVGRRPDSDGSYLIRNFYLPFLENASYFYGKFYNVPFIAESHIEVIL